MSKDKFKQKIRDNIPTLFLKGSTVESVRALTEAWQHTTQGKEVEALVRAHNEETSKLRTRIAELERDLIEQRALK